MDFVKIGFLSGIFDFVFLGMKGLKKGGKRKFTFPGASYPKTRK